MTTLSLREAAAMHGIDRQRFMGIAIGLGVEIHRTRFADLISEENAQVIADHDAAWEQRNPSPCKRGRPVTKLPA